MLGFMQTHSCQPLVPKVGRLLIVVTISVQAASPTHAAESKHLILHDYDSWVTHRGYHHARTHKIMAQAQNDKIVVCMYFAAIVRQRREHVSCSADTMVFDKEDGARQY